MDYLSTRSAYIKHLRASLLLKGQSRQVVLAHIL